MSYSLLIIVLPPATLMVKLSLALINSGKLYLKRSAVGTIVRSYTLLMINDKGYEW